MKSWVSRSLSVVAALSLTVAPGEVDALAPGDVPPAVDLQDRSGVPVKLESLRGKVVLLDFWASWCGPCKQEMPVLEALHNKYKSQGLVIVGINIDNQQKKMDNFLKSNPVTFRLVRDEKLAVASRYEPPTMPSSYFIGRGGKIRMVHEGFRKKDIDKLEAMIVTLLAEAWGAMPSDASPSTAAE
ncbi:MAG: TlpA disulfide reductase family protein [Myxococcota bacterium]